LPRRRPWGVAITNYAGALPSSVATASSPLPWGVAAANLRLRNGLHFVIEARDAVATVGRRPLAATAGTPPVHPRRRGRRRYIRDGGDAVGTSATAGTPPVHPRRRGRRRYIRDGGDAVGTSATARTLSPLGVSKKGAPEVFAYGALLFLEVAEPNYSISSVRLE